MEAVREGLDVLCGEEKFSPNLIFRSLPCVRSKELVCIIYQEVNYHISIISELTCASSCESERIAPQGIEFR